MSTELWKLPVPASALVKGPDFAMLPKRRCDISFQFENSAGEISKATLTFEAVEAFKTTFMSSLDAALITAAYGKLVDLGESSWLVEAKQRVSAYYARMKKVPPVLRHLAICFDDGPCFEVICADYKLPS